MPSMETSSTNSSSSTRGVGAASSRPLDRFGGDGGVGGGGGHGASGSRPAHAGRVVVPIYSTRCQNGSLMDEPRVEGDDGTPGVARGRRPSTSRQDVARAALDLFHRQGYDETTVD